MTVVPLAHQGGWDEVLVFALPVLLYGAVRLWERYRGGNDAADAAGDDDATQD